MEERIALPPGLQAGQVLWVDTQQPGGPVERRFLVLTRSEIQRGWVKAERVAQLQAGDVGMSTNSADVRALTGSMEPAKPLDHVSLPALHEGHVGRFWRGNLAALRKRLPTDRPDGTVAYWIVEAPWAHPVWHSYNVLLVHLRDIGLPTKFYLDGATHELWLHALNPEQPRDPFVRGRASPMEATLSPKQFAAQFIEPNDQAAAARVTAALEEVCAGRLSPDSDHHHQLEWARRFGDNMMKRGYGLHG